MLEYNGGLSGAGMLGRRGRLEDMLRRGEESGSGGGGIVVETRWAGVPVVGEDAAGLDVVDVVELVVRPVEVGGGGGEDGGRLFTSGDMVNLVLLKIFEAGGPWV
jgi:hypothetical protein